MLFHLLIFIIFCHGLTWKYLTGMLLISSSRKQSDPVGLYNRRCFDMEIVHFRTLTTKDCFCRTLRKNRVIVTFISIWINRWGHCRHHVVDHYAICQQHWIAFDNNYSRNWYITHKIIVISHVITDKIHDNIYQELPCVYSFSDDWVCEFCSTSLSTQHSLSQYRARKDYALIYFNGSLYM